MKNQLGPTPTHTSSSHLPALVAKSGEQAARRFLEFFASNIRNRNTRIAYSHAVGLFLTWCEEYGVPSLGDVQPLHIAAWLELESQTTSAPTVKQRLAAIRHLFDCWSSVRSCRHPAGSVRGPSISSAKARPPCWSRSRRAPCSTAST